ncbi:MAG: oligosaccharide flippase family protein [Burkholderiales bacterium]|nr:oligosaccharide flippase family protein [Burkholderiales bacterium]
MLRRLLSDNALLVLQYAAASLVPLLLVPHFVRTLGAANFGAIAMLIAALGLASIVVQYAFTLTGPAELAQRSGDGDAQRRVLLDSLAARLLLLAIVLLGALVLIVLLPARLRLTALVLLALPVGAAVNVGWFLQATQRVHVLALLGTLAAALSLTIGFIMVRDDSTVLWAAIALAAGPLALAVGTLLWSLATLPAGGVGVSIQSARASLVRGWPLFSSQFVSALYAQIGPLVVGAISGVAAAGLYGAIERIANAIQAALGLTHTAAYPQLARLFAGSGPDRPRYRQLVHVVLGLQLAGVAALGVALLAFSAEVQQFIFGQSTSATAALLWAAYGWIALSVFGPLLTGYWTVSGQGVRVLPLTLRVLLVSLPAGALLTWAIGGAGWLLGLIAGQLLVALAALKAYRNITRP